MVDVVKLTVDWREADSGVPEARQEAFTQQLMQDLRASSAVKRVDRIPDPAVPDGGMGAQWLWSILTAEISQSTFKLALQEVFDRLPGKPIDVLVEIDGRKIEMKQIRPDDIDKVAEKLANLGQKLKDIE